MDTVGLSWQEPAHPLTLALPRLYLCPRATLVALVPCTSRQRRLRMTFFFPMSLQTSTEPGALNQTEQFLAVAYIKCTIGLGLG